MHKIRVKIAWFYKTTYLPVSWDQIDPGLLKVVLKTLVSYPETTARLFILRRLLRMNRRTFARLSDGQLWDLLNCISFISLKDLRSQPIKSFAKGWTLPDTNFRYGTCYEFAKADYYFKRFKESKSKQDLDLFFATLARHKNNPSINEEEIKSKLSKIKKTPEYIKLVTVCYFGGIKNLVHDLYGEFLFKSDLESNSSASAYVPKFNLEWWGIFNSIAESGVFGNIRSVHQSNFHDVCTYLVQKKEEYLATKSTENES